MWKESFVKSSKIYFIDLKIDYIKKRLIRSPHSLLRKRRLADLYLEKDFILL